MDRMNQLYDSLLALTTETSVNLPADVRRALRKAGRSENPSSRAGQALSIIELNVDMAKQDSGPICQDTGMPTFFVDAPVSANQMEITEAIEKAVSEATRLGKLRPNSVDSVTGRNSGNNLGPGTPVIHFHQWDKDEIRAMLLLKGGGCENKNIQYSLPADLPHLGAAGRDLDGVYRCIMHAVWQAQGHGCSAGFLGVCIGGDRTTGYEHAKAQLLREVDDRNDVQALAELEEKVLRSAAELHIGTMGFGGAVTLLGCKIGALNRLPASFFVSVAYNCWAFRRLGVAMDTGTGEIRSWIYRDENPERLAQAGGFATTGREIELSTPITEEQARGLRVGDVVVLSGPLVTGRDALHKYLAHHDSPVDLRGAALYHCGPVVMKAPSGEWRVTAAGPTTSIREEPYQADLLRKFGIRAVIGKGGMGARTLQGLRECGAVYLNAIGGAA
ncbi:MAG TPA: fumarate hydratase, partial [Chthonomonadales bacterium]|nr:fumarate hydratase [Chthonomonadales bacterium]